jgi:hypothetical protein
MMSFLILLFLLLVALLAPQYGRDSRLDTDRWW